MKFTVYLSTTRDYDAEEVYEVIRRAIRAGLNSLSATDEYLIAEDLLDGDMIIDRDRV